MSRHHNRAILSEISERNLDPNQKYVLGKNGLVLESKLKEKNDSLEPSKETQRDVADNANLDEKLTAKQESEPEEETEVKPLEDSSLNEQDNLVLDKSVVENKTKKKVKLKQD